MRRLAGLALAAGIVGTTLIATPLLPVAPASAAGSGTIESPRDGDTVYRIDYTLDGEQVSGFDVTGTADDGAELVLSYWRSIDLYDAAKPCFTAATDDDAACTLQSTGGSGATEFRFDGQPIEVGSDGGWSTRVNMTQWLRGAEAGEYDITLALVSTNADGGATLGDPVRLVFDSTTTADAAAADAEPAPTIGAGPPLWVWLLVAFLVLDLIALVLILVLRRRRVQEAAEAEERLNVRRRSTHREPPAS
ncbi:hypothetical protein KXS11_13400 [Plantibacter flavus]|uniref:hypothetical protein n=1 Tax=Plantibacter flavus TaxID=150123 RepID=UPI003F17A2B0